MIIKNNRELKSKYDQLGAGDILLGTFSSKHLKQTVLLDLLERGVCCIPSALSQTLNNSKVAQAHILKKWMLPQTKVILRRMDLVEAITSYGKNGISTVVTKQNHMHCGHGVRRWNTIEDLYNHLGFSKSSFPFVLQPYVENFIDARVLVVGDYVESYIRENPYNFRNNISTGGKSRPFKLNVQIKNFCYEVIQRGKFPYAHIDLLIFDNGEFYLSEIALNGGTKGALINRKELYRLKQELLLTLVENNTKTKKPRKLKIED